MNLESKKMFIDETLHPGKHFTDFILGQVNSVFNSKELLTILFC